MSDKYVWTPTQAFMERSNIGRFMRRHGIVLYADLVARSTTDIEWFWNAVIEDLGIEFYRPYDTASRHRPRRTLVALVHRRTGQSRAQLPRPSCPIRTIRPHRGDLGR